MMFTSLKRMVRSGFVGFWRNSFLSFSSIVVFSISLLVLGSLIFFNTLTTAFIAKVKDRVDVNIYFTLDAREESILEFKKTLEKMPEVSKVDYISREEAIASFTEKYKDNTPIIEGLKEIGYNPLPATLNVKTKEPSQYESIANLLENKDTLPKNISSIIEDDSYHKNKLIIDRLSRIIPLVERTGWVLSIALLIVALIITFNTIRLSIYSSKDEIAVMKLVGASNTYARGPFVVSGVMYGIVSGVIALVILAGLTYYVDLILVRFLSAYPGDVSGLKNLLFSYYVSHFIEILIVIIGSGVILGGASSYIAVRRYLNV